MEGGSLKKGFRIWSSDSIIALTEFRPGNNNIELTLGTDGRLQFVLNGNDVGI